MIDILNDGDHFDAIIYYHGSPPTGNYFSGLNNKAAYNLGYFYTGGLGVPMDLKEALKWYEISAKDGNIDAQINLGFAYMSGHGTKKDLHKASFWIKKAKDTGSSKAKLIWEQFKLDEYGDKI